MLKRVSAEITGRRVIAVALIAMGGFSSRAMEIATRLLPSAVAMSPYDVRLTAVGTAPVTWREAYQTFDREKNTWWTEATRKMGTNVWKTLSAAGVARGWRADEGAWALDLPFEFEFYGKRYRRAWVSSNGHISFNGPITNAVSDLSRCCVLMPLGNRNLRTDRGSDDIFVSLSETEVVVRWSAARHDDDEFEYPGAYRFAVVLTKGGGVRFVYGIIPPSDSAPALIGIGSGESGKCWRWVPARAAYWLYEARDFVFTTASLPRGLSLSADGVISGTADAPAGEYAVIVEASDAGGKTSVRRIPLVVRPSLK